MFWIHLSVAVVLSVSLVVTKVVATRKFMKFVRPSEPSLLEKEWPSMVEGTIEK